MKSYIILLSLFSLVFVACSGDGTSELHYDDSNFSAPILSEGTHEAAARFLPSVVSEFNGQVLTGIRYYIQNLPNNCTVKVYARGTDISPGALLYEQNVINETRANRWNEHTLTTPINLDGSELWIAVELVHNSSIASIGCDEGPADSNGDFLYDIVGLNWSTFRTLTNGETSINWNIRGIVSEE